MIDYFIKGNTKNEWWTKGDCVYDGSVKEFCTIMGKDINPFKEVKNERVALLIYDVIMLTWMNYVNKAGVVYIMEISDDIFCYMKGEGFANSASNIDIFLTRIKYKEFI